METSICGVEIIDRVNSEIVLLQKNVAFSEFYIEKARLQSFDGWSKTLKQTPEQLSAAGFFYTLKDDRVICFCCGGGLHTWVEQDDPWEQHALYYGSCEYLQLMKGREFITSVQKTFIKIYSEIFETKPNEDRWYFDENSKIYHLSNDIIVNIEPITKPIHEMDIDIVD